MSCGAVTLEAEPPPDLLVLGISLVFVTIHHRLLLQGISFSDFKNFFLFLNHLDDFILMMRLYNLTDQPVSKGKY